MRHIKSFGITFLVAFAMVFLADIDNISLSTFSDGAIFGVAFGALRAGVKAVLELFVFKYSS